MNQVTRLRQWKDLHPGPFPDGKERQILMAHAGKRYEVEFIALDGETVAVTSLTREQIDQSNVARSRTPAASRQTS